MISHNAPQPAVTIPVTFTVTGSATYGQISGVVTALAACDAPGSPLDGATVKINGGAAGTSTTDASGHYLYWLPGGITYTVSFEHASSVSQTVQMAVTAQQTTTHNVDLRPMVPCQSLPTSAITSTQQIDSVVTKTLTVQNTGAGPLVWTVQERAPALLIASDTQNYQRVSRYIPVATIPPVAPLVNTVQDGSFEATNSTTYANPYWGQNSSTFGTILCNAACATTGDVTPHTGLFFAWFGGSATGDVGYIQQTAILTPGLSTLSFYLWITDNSARQ